MTPVAGRGISAIQKRRMNAQGSDALRRGFYGRFGRDYHVYTGMCRLMPSWVVGYIAQAIKAPSWLRLRSNGAGCPSIYVEGGPHLSISLKRRMSIIDKNFLFGSRGIERAVYACQGIFCIEKQRLAMRLGKEGGSAAALLRNQITFRRSHPSGRHF